ncbi:MAG: hypothetical protein ABH846_01915, partial [Patescibacteria group bacterium]
MREQRDQVIRLAKLQDELREDLQKYLDDHELLVNTFATSAGLLWAQVKTFLTRDGAVCGGETLAAITSKLERPDLQVAIESVASNIDARTRGFATCSEWSIELAFEVKIFCEGLKSKYTGKFLAPLFKPYEEVFLGITQTSSKAVRQLDDPDTSLAFYAVLTCDDLEDRLDQLVEQDKAVKQTKIRQLRTLIAERMPGVKQKKDQAERLGVSYDSLNKIFKRRATMALIDKLIASAEALPVSGYVTDDEEVDDSISHEPELESDNETGFEVTQDEAPSPEPETERALEPEPEVTPAPEPEPAPIKLPDVCAICNKNGADKEMVPEAPLRPTARELLEAFGGETSPLGVRFVLGPNSFQDIDINPGHGFVQWAVWALEMARMA